MPVMLMIPHIRIANRVRQVMERRFDERINPAAFALGSVFPDILKRTETGYHDVAEAVCQMRRYRMEAPKGRWRSSFRRGMICHFAADSFCQAHIGRGQYTRRGHVLYEIRQCRQLKRSLGQAEKAALACSYPAGDQAMSRFLQDQRQFASRRRSYRQEAEAVVKGCVMALRSAAG